VLKIKVQTNKKNAKEQTIKLLTLQSCKHFLSYQYFFKIQLIIMKFPTSCFSKNDEKRMYLAGWEAEFNGDEQCHKFIKTQTINKETADTISQSLELVFRNNKLVKIYDVEDVFDGKKNKKTERPLKESEKGFEFIDVKAHQIYAIQRSLNSNSYLGGEPPIEFKMPKLDFAAPSQYLGKLSKLDKAFCWLPFDLHIIAPIYSNFSQLFIDYSDQMEPQIINVEELRLSGTEYEDLKPNSEIIFKKNFISAEKSNDFGDGTGSAGVPNWLQFPEIPTCPKSNRTMKFLCQLGSNIGVDTERTNVKTNDEWYQHYFETMNFWSDGELYIFFEPESKVACFIIQTT
jgi:hypothetical protein